MSLSLNVIVTLLIAGRLLVYRYHMRKIMGRQHTTTYSNIIAILVESAALYSVFAILFIVPFGLGNPVGNIFLQVVNQVQVGSYFSTATLMLIIYKTVSSLLIIFRVARGTAWSGNTATRVTNRSASQSIRLPQISDMAFRTNQSSTAADSRNSKDVQIPGVVITRDMASDADYRV